MKREILLLGLVGGILITVLQLTEYRFLVLEHSFAIYGAMIAVIFAGMGLWLGMRSRPGTRADGAAGAAASTVAVQEKAPAEGVGAGLPEAAAQPGAFAPDGRKRDELGITPREMEILGLVAQGMSNREIAEALFVSENTVKTHCSRTFDKLGARRRTQAVQIGKELGLLP